MCLCMCVSEVGGDGYGCGGEYSENRGPRSLNSYTVLQISVGRDQRLGLMLLLLLNHFSRV